MKKIIILFFTTIICIQLFAQSKNLPIIDMHLHIYYENSYWGGNETNAADTVLQSPPDFKSHFEEIIKQYEKYNIVLSYAGGNFESLDYIKDNYPDLFFPSIEIWPTKKLFAQPLYLKTINTKIQNGDILGIGEVLNLYTGFAPNHPIMDSIYKIAEKYDLPVGIHFGLAPPGCQLHDFPNLRIEYGNPLLLQDILIKYPKLRIYAMHAGLTNYMDEIISMMVMFPNLYADIAILPWYTNGTKKSLDEFLENAVLNDFVDRILFGSDAMVWPEAIGMSVEYFKKADFLTEKQKRDILYNNAARFLRLDEKTIARHFEK